MWMVEVQRRLGGAMTSLPASFCPSDHTLHSMQHPWMHAMWEMRKQNHNLVDFMVAGSLLGLLAHSKVDLAPGAGDYVCNLHPCTTLRVEILLLVSEEISSLYEVHSIIKALLAYW
jgi:hypothetical protein